MSTAVTVRGGWIEASSAVYRALFRPARYFRETPPGDLLRNALIGVIPLLFVSALLMFLAALLNADAIREAGRELLNRDGLRPDDLPFALEPAVPFGRLVFPAYWLVLLLYLALVRRGVFAAVGARGASFLQALAVTGHAAVGMILAAAFLGILNQLFSIMPDPGVSLGRVLFALALFSVGWLLEGRVWFAAGPERFALTRGQAILVWLAPIFDGIVLLILTIFALLILAASGST